MTDFYMNYLDLCKEKNIQPVSDEAARLWGVTKAAISGWKNKDSMPSYDAMFNMMNYFNIAIPVLENRELFLENNACYISIEGRVNGKLACMMAYDIFHVNNEMIGYAIKNTMLSLEPEGTIVVRPSTKDEIKKFTSGNAERDGRYRLVSQAEAHKIFKEKTGQYISLG